MVVVREQEARRSSRYEAKTTVAVPLRGSSRRCPRGQQTGARQIAAHFGTQTVENRQMQVSKCCIKQERTANRGLDGSNFGTTGAQTASQIEQETRGQP